MKLHYFDIYAKGEAIRMLLNHAKVEFEDHRMQFTDMAAVKPECEFGQVPMLEHDGKKMVQSNSILRYLGKLYGYYPADVYEQFLVDSAIDAVDDFYVKVVRQHFEKDEERKKTMKEDALKYLTVVLDAFEKRLTSNTTQKHLVGEKLTVADIAFASIVSSILTNEAHSLVADFKPLVEAHPVVVAYIETLKEEMKEYLATRPQPRPF